MRLYERGQLGNGRWMYRIGIPLWQTAAGGGVEPVEYDTWVTPAQLRPIPGVDLSSVPTSGRPVSSTPVGWTWVLNARSRAGRAATLHAAECRLADRARPLTTEAALDALARPGTVACTGCDAAEVLLPILSHGQDHPPSLGD